MDAQATQPPSGSSAYPRWVMLKHNGDREDESSCSSADAKTMAAARTSTGLLIRVAFILAPPPAVSRLCFHLPGAEAACAKVVAAHADSVLIDVYFGKQRWPDGQTQNYFVYNAGAAAAEPPRPPSLSLLAPEISSSIEQEMERFWPQTLDMEATGLLRRGGDELAVAKVSMVVASDEDDQPARKVLELLLFRSGEWSTGQSPVKSPDDGGEGRGAPVPSLWKADKVVPVYGRFLCWVDLRSGVILSDVLADKPWLRYVPLPVDYYFGRASHRNVCSTAGGGALKFVDISPRCCCGGRGGTNCRRSHGAYTIHTWTLRTDDMAWVMDGIIDAAELWALDAYRGLPRVQLKYPVVSTDDPHAICFVVEGDGVWLIMLDTRSKTLQSVICHTERNWLHHTNNLIPSKVSDYLNSHPSSSNGDTPPPSATRIKNDVKKNSVQSSSRSSSEPGQVSEILVALEEVPGLARDDMLKAYSILCNGNGRRYKNLLGLPMHLRKDWRLMEIKASEACFFCSTCAADLQQHA